VKFNPGWRLSLFVCLVLPILVAAGFWQLDRAEQKLILKKGYELQITQPPQNLETVIPAAFTTVTFNGAFSANDYYLVDNATHEGRVGYQVIHLVHLAPPTGAKAVLVNRGWVPAPKNREDLPEIDTPTGVRRFEGVLWPDLGLPLLLADDPWSQTFPKRVQRLNIARMAQELELEFEWQIRLVSGSPGTYTPPRLNIAFGVDRHYGYALQWFGLAVVLLVGFVVVGVKR